jgi:hypothetical protein
MNYYDFELNSKCIITDFEKATINAVSNIFLQYIQKGCIFHLGKNLWRKIQSCRLATQYGSDEDFNLKLQNIPALAFLPPGEIKQAFEIIKNDLSIEISVWFDEVYINGKIRRTLRDGTINRSPPLFLPSFWSICFNNENGIPRTQNKVVLAQKMEHFDWSKSCRLSTHHFRIEKKQQHTLGKNILFIYIFIHIYLFYYL